MDKLYIPPVLVLYSIILIVIAYFFIPAFNLLIPFPFNLFGGIISFLGFLLMAKTRDLFRKHATTLKIEESSSIIKEGPFLKTRNPMYVGMFLLLLGFAVISTNLLALIIPFFFVLVLRVLIISKEEKLMLKEFGDEYIEYKRKVRMFF